VVDFGDGSSHEPAGSLMTIGNEWHAEKSDVIVASYNIITDPIRLRNTDSVFLEARIALTLGPDVLVNYG